MRLITTLFSTFLLLFPLSWANAQDLDRYLCFGPSVASYKGDLNSSYDKLGGGFNVMIVPERDKLLQTALELNIGTVSGQQKGYISTQHPEQTPNDYFQTNFASVSFHLRAYLYRRNNIKVFIGQGLGAMRFVPKDEKGSHLLDSTSTRFSAAGSTSAGETYSNLSIILPRNIGIQYTLKNEMAVSLDLNQQANQTDYIDNISVLGNRSKKDKVLLVRFSLMIPILYKKDLSEPADPIQ